MNNFVIYIYLAALYIALTVQNTPKLKIDQGWLTGKYAKAWNGRDFASFTGIPYAKPPLGDLRFKPPVPADTWNDVFNASKSHNICPQISIYVWDYDLQGNEDCLYLNVYTPQLPNKLLPVMYYIHGGGWMTGSSNSELYGPELILSKDVVLVTANYRLGVLGFLSTGDDVVPGNNGLKDQNLALKWIKQNIAYFGGDPERITIFGQSAGGASSHYHTLSPLSRNLLHGAIIQSGVALAPWAFAPRALVDENNKKLAKFLNCSLTSSQSFVNCLREVDAYTIVEQDLKFMYFGYDPMIPFKPVVEPDLEGAFITEDPVDIIKSGEAGNIPIMIGLTSEDGCVKSSYLYKGSDLITKIDENFEKYGFLTLNYDYVTPNDNLTNSIRKFYFGNKKIDKNTISATTDMYTDVVFSFPEDITVRLLKKYWKQPVYKYLFGYRGSDSYSRLFGDSGYNYGACHGDELLYLFDSKDLFNISTFNEADKKMIQITTSLWTNFATTGNPTPELDSLISTKWKPITTSNLEYYSIKGTDNLSMRKNMFADRIAFWRNTSLNAKFNIDNNEF